MLRSSVLEIFTVPMRGGSLATYPPATKTRSVALEPEEAVLRLDQAADLR